MPKKMGRRKHGGAQNQASAAEEGQLCVMQFEGQHSPVAPHYIHVLDVSASMSWKKIDFSDSHHGFNRLSAAKAIIEGLLDPQAPNSTILAFNNTVKKYDIAEPDDLNKIWASGGTNIESAAMELLNELQSHPQDQPVVVIFYSDGAESSDSNVIEYVARKLVDPSWREKRKLDNVRFGAVNIESGASADASTAMMSLFPAPNFSLSCELNGCTHDAAIDVTNQLGVDKAVNVIKEKLKTGDVLTFPEQSPLKAAVCGNPFSPLPSVFALNQNGTYYVLMQKPLDCKGVSGQLGSGITVNAKSCQPFDDNNPHHQELLEKVLSQFQLTAMLTRILHMGILRYFGGSSSSRIISENAQKNLVATCNLSLEGILSVLTGYVALLSASRPTTKTGEYCVVHLIKSTTGFDSEREVWVEDASPDISDQSGSFLKQAAKVLQDLIDMLQSKTLERVDNKTLIQKAASASQGFRGGISKAAQAKLTQQATKKKKQQVQGADDSSHLLSELKGPDQDSKYRKALTNLAGIEFAKISEFNLYVHQHPGTVFPALGKVCDLDDFDAARRSCFQLMRENRISPDTVDKALKNNPESLHSVIKDFMNTHSLSSNQLLILLQNYAIFSFFLNNSPYDKNVESLYQKTNHLGEDYFDAFSYLCDWVRSSNIPLTPSRHEKIICKEQAVPQSYHKSGVQSDVTRLLPTEMFEALAMPYTNNERTKKREVRNSANQHVSTCLLLCDLTLEIYKQFPECQVALMSLRALIAGVDGLENAASTDCVEVWQMLSGKACSVDWDKWRLTLMSHPKIADGMLQHLMENMSDTTTHIFSHQGYASRPANYYVACLLSSEFFEQDDRLFSQVAYLAVQKVCLDFAKSYPALVETEVLTDKMFDDDAAFSFNLSGLLRAIILIAQFRKYMRNQHRSSDLSTAWINVSAEDQSQFATLQGNLAEKSLIELQAIFGKEVIPDCETDQDLASLGLFEKGDIETYPFSFASQVLATTKEYAGSVNYLPPVASLAEYQRADALANSLLEEVPSEQQGGAVTRLDGINKEAVDAKKALVSVNQYLVAQLLDKAQDGLCQFLLSLYFSNKIVQKHYLFSKVKFHYWSAFINVPESELFLEKTLSPFEKAVYLLNGLLVKGLNKHCLDILEPIKQIIGFLSQEMKLPESDLNKIVCNLVIDFSSRNVFYLSRYQDLLSSLGHQFTQGQVKTLQALKKKNSDEGQSVNQQERGESGADDEIRSFKTLDCSLFQRLHALYLQYHYDKMQPNASLVENKATYSYTQENQTSTILISEEFLRKLFGDVQDNRRNRPDILGRSISKDLGEFNRAFTGSTRVKLQVTPAGQLTDTNGSGFFDFNQKGVEAVINAAHKRRYQALFSDDAVNKDFCRQLKSFIKVLENFHSKSGLDFSDVFLGKLKDVLKIIVSSAVVLSGMPSKEEVATLLGHCMTFCYTLLLAYVDSLKDLNETLDKSESHRIVKSLLQLCPTFETVVAVDTLLTSIARKKQTSLFTFNLGRGKAFLRGMFDDDPENYQDNPLIKFYMRYDKTYSFKGVFHDAFLSFPEIQLIYELLYSFCSDKLTTPEALSQDKLYTFAKGELETVYSEINGKQKGYLAGNVAPIANQVLASIVMNFRSIVLPGLCQLSGIPSPDLSVASKQDSVIPEPVPEISPEQVFVGKLKAATIYPYDIEEYHFSDAAQSADESPQAENTSESIAEESQISEQPVQQLWHTAQLSQPYSLEAPYAPPTLNDLRHIGNLWPTTCDDLVVMSVRVVNNPNHQCLFEANMQLLAARDGNPRYEGSNFDDSNMAAKQAFEFLSKNAKQYSGVKFIPAFHAVDGKEAADGIAKVGFNQSAATGARFGDGVYFAGANPRYAFNNYGEFETVDTVSQKRVMLAMVGVYNPAYLSDHNVLFQYGQPKTPEDAHVIDVNDGPHKQGLEVVVNGQNCPMYELTLAETKEVSARDQIKIGAAHFFKPVRDDAVKSSFINAQVHIASTFKR